MKPPNPKSNSDLHVEIMAASSHHASSPSDIVVPKKEIYRNRRIQRCHRYFKQHFE
jgi:hypothetical protein